MTRIVLCGGSGYIGTKLTEILFQDTDYDIVIIDKLDFKLNQDFKNKYYNDERVKFYQKDIRDEDFLKQIIREKDIVVNLAALVGEPLCKLKPEEAVSVNLDAAKRLAAICANNKAEKFIQLSTCSNYGKAVELVDENSELYPTSLYAETKVELEKFLLKNISNSVILRCATAYGVSQGRMRFDLLLSEFIKDAWLHKEINVFMPQVHRPLVHINDISEAIKLCIKNPIETPRVFNVGSNDQNFTKREIAEKVASHLKVPIKITEKEDKRDYSVNFDRIRKEFGFKTRFDVDHGIKEMVSILETGKFDLDQANV